MAENETQETTENAEVTEAVATQSPSTDQGIDDPPTASEELAEDKTETKTEDSAEAETEEKPEAKTEETPAEPEEEEEISYHAVEKEGDITAIWEMQGAKHLRTISPRSTEGQKILNLFTSEIHETDSPSLAESA
jgi:Ca2+-dependent lipid-binding protein